MDDPCENLTTSSETHRATNETGGRNMKNAKGQTDNTQTSQTRRAQKDTNIGRFLWELEMRANFLQAAATF